MSAKDVVVKVLKSKSKRCTKYVRNLNGGVDEAISYRLEFTPNELAQQILDSLPRLDRDRVKELSIKLLVDKYSPAGYSEKDIDEIVDQICSLIPAGEVIAEGIVESDSTTCKSLRDFVSNIDGFTSLPIKENLKGKKVQIIIREVTD